MPVDRIRSEVRNFWRFYRRYTNTAVHTASTAMLAMFGLLVFVDPWFALVAITSYVVPPFVLFVVERTRQRSDSNSLGDPTGRVDSDDGWLEARDAAPDASVPRPNAVDDSKEATRKFDRRNADSDADWFGSDTDQPDGNSDTDTDQPDGNSDTDTDRSDGDSDSDTDSDTDTDRSDGDTDS